MGSPPPTGDGPSVGADRDASGLDPLLEALSPRADVRCHLTAPRRWAPTMPSGSVISFHAVARILQVGCPHPIPLREGTLAVVHRHRRHTLASDATTLALALTDLVGPEPQRAPRSFALPGRPATEVICGGIALDERPWRHLLPALPRVSVVEADATMDHLLQAAAAELTSMRPGSGSILDRIAEAKPTTKPSAFPDRRRVPIARVPSCPSLRLRCTCGASGRRRDRGSTVMR